MLKTFYYQFIDPPFLQSIQVNTKECPTIQDLTKKIAAFFNLSYYHLNVENQPKEKQLEKITEKFIFIITFPNRRKDITFFFQKLNSIHLKNGYNLNYMEIICSFQQNNLFYSNECVQNQLKFKLFDKDLPQIEFPLLAIPSGICVNVKTDCETVILKYGNKTFIFAENEIVLEALKLIKETFEGCHSVLIQTNERKMKENDMLKRFVAYEVNVMFLITFKNIENWAEVPLYLNFLSTVSDAQKQLSTKFGENEPLSHSKIIIYNGNMQEIKDCNQMLKRIQDFSNFFYFEIKKKSPEKVTKIKPNFELDPIFLYTPNKKTKPLYNDYSKTPEPIQKFNFNYDVSTNSKTPEKDKKPNLFSAKSIKTKTSRSDFDSNRKQANKSKMNSNFNMKQNQSINSNFTDFNSNKSASSQSKKKLNQNLRQKQISNSRLPPNDFISTPKKKSSNNSVIEEDSYINLKQLSDSKISDNDPNFDFSQEPLSNSKQSTTKKSSESSKKVPDNSKSEKSTNSNTKQSKFREDDDYDDYFENDLSSKQDQLKENSDDFQQSLELEELKNLMNDDEEEEINDTNGHSNLGNNNVKKENIEEEEFNDLNDNIILSNNIKDENEEEMESDSQNKIESMSNDDVFSMNDEELNDSKSNKFETNQLEIYEEEEDSK